MSRFPALLSGIRLMALILVFSANAAGGIGRSGLPDVSPASGPIALPAPEGEMAPSRWWTRFYGTGFYDTRWDGWFLHSYLQQGYDLVPDRRLSLYGIAWLSGDSRSSGSGPAPAIISDNLLLLGAGLRYRPAPWIWFDLQEGLAFDLVDRGGSKAVRGDFRLIATGGTGIYPDFQVHDDVRAPLGLMADVFFSAGYYSRYRDGIGYLQGRVGARVFEVSRSFLDLYLRGDAAFDTDDRFYHNLYEIGPGLRFTPDPAWGLFFLAEYRRGFYADRTEEMRARRALFYPAQYDAVRLYLVLDLETGR